MEPYYNLTSTTTQECVLAWMQFLYGEERLFCCWPHNPHFTN